MKCSECINCQHLKVYFEDEKGQLRGLENTYFVGYCHKIDEYVIDKEECECENYEKEE